MDTPYNPPSVFYPDLSIAIDMEQAVEILNEVTASGGHSPALLKLINGILQKAVENVETLKKETGLSAQELLGKETIDDLRKLLNK